MPLKIEIFHQQHCILNKYTERAVLAISHVKMTTLLLVPGFYTPNLDLCERQLLNFISVSNFYTHL